MIRHVHFSVLAAELGYCDARWRHGNCGAAGGWCPSMFGGVHAISAIGFHNGLELSTLRDCARASGESRLWRDAAQ